MSFSFAKQVCGDCLSNASTSGLYSWKLQVSLIQKLFVFFFVVGNFRYLSQMPNVDHNLIFVPLLMLVCDRLVVVVVWVLSIFLAVPIILTKVGPRTIAKRTLFSVINLLNLQNVFTYFYANCSHLVSLTYCNDSDDSIGWVFSSILQNNNFFNVGYTHHKLNDNWHCGKTEFDLSNNHENAQRDVTMIFDTIYQMLWWKQARKPRSYTSRKSACPPSDLNG